jgi:hypothetical protein
MDYEWKGLRYHRRSVRGRKTPHGDVSWNKDEIFCSYGKSKPRYFQGSYIVSDWYEVSHCLFVVHLPHNVFIMVIDLQMGIQK